MCETTRNYFHITVFEIHIGTQQLPRLLPREICIFSDMRHQIIAEAKLSLQHLC